MKKSISLLLLILSIHLYGQELPCKSYYKQSEGGRCKERYKEDANGDRHGLFILYDQNGAVQMRGNLVHGKPEGNWLSDGEYGWFVNGDCIKYKAYGIYSPDRFTAEEGWHETCIESSKPIKSLEEAKAIAAKLYQAEKQRVDEKLKKEVDK